MALRSSGASHNDSLLVLLTFAIAGGIVVMLLGGPREAIFQLEVLMRKAVAAVEAYFQ